LGHRPGNGAIWETTHLAWLTGAKSLYHQQTSPAPIGPRKTAAHAKSPVPIPLGGLRQLSLGHANAREMRVSGTNSAFERCGWGCGAEPTGYQMRAHFTRCPNRRAALRPRRPLREEPVSQARPPTRAANAVRLALPLQTQGSPDAGAFHRLL